MKSEHQLKVYVAGHRGMVGAAILRALQARGGVNVITAGREDVDLTRQAEVERFFQKEKPEQVYIAAARVGGILANSLYPTQFLYQNIMIASNLIEASFRFGVKRLLFLGSSCIYPRLAPQPMLEESLLAGPLEVTNEPYAIAKIAGLKLCDYYCAQYGESHGIDYRSLMPTNLYGPGDKYHPQNSHVIPGLIQRMHAAKTSHRPTVEVWGSGRALREFLFVDDLADACLHIMGLSKSEYEGVVGKSRGHLNVGSGEELSIAEVAEMIRVTVGFQGDLEFDTEKPDGTPRKLLDTSKMSTSGWFPKTNLAEGLKKTYAAFCEQVASE